MRWGRHIPIFASVLFCGCYIISAQAQVGGNVQKCIERYGQPEKNTLAKNSLLFFAKNGICYIAHFHRGLCDTLCIFSEKTNQSLSEDLSDEQICALLISEGNAHSWIPIARFYINKGWNSSDMKSFAIYETMRHKLVIMTRDSYKREKQKQ